MKIAVVGTEYVGLSLSKLLAQKNEVMKLDIIHQIGKMLNNKISPIDDFENKSFLENRSRNLVATIGSDNAAGTLNVSISDLNSPVSFLNSCGAS